MPIIAALAWIGGYLLQAVVAINPQVTTAYILFRYAYVITLSAAYAVIYLTMRGIKVSMGVIIIPALAFDTFTFINFRWHAISAAHA